MLGRLIKKKLDTDKMANVFVNSLLEVTENGFDDVRAMINEDTSFIESPNVPSVAADKFLLIVIVGNLRFLEDHFEADEAREIHQMIIEKLAAIYDMDFASFEQVIKDYDAFVSRVNHPSKNTLYGMSKAVFHKFNLNGFQEPYFKNMRTPNPLFLKRMDEIMMNFLWDWEAFFNRYKVNF